MKRCVWMLLAALLSTAANAQQNERTNDDGKKISKPQLEANDYMPEVHGTIRSKYEYQTEMGAGRFEVRTARLSVTGNILPAVAYKAEIDLCDEGNIKMLDAYARLFPVKGLTVTAGQMRVPFTIDAHRSPHQQYFANRSFIAKQVGNVRDVGLTLGYTLPTELPVSIEAGMYNGNGLVDQKTAWSTQVNYSAKASVMLMPGWNLTLSSQSIRPVDVSLRSVDAGMYYESGAFHIEAEYLYKTYSDHAFKDVQAVNSFINYDLKMRKGPFTKISLLARYDFMTDQNDGKKLAKDADGNELDGVLARDDRGQLKITDYRRQRVTGGITLSLSKAFRTDLRLNFEKYFYPSGSIAKESEQDKVVLELMVRF